MHDPEIICVSHQSSTFALDRNKYRDGLLTDLIHQPRRRLKKTSKRRIETWLLTLRRNGNMLLQTLKDVPGIRSLKDLTHHNLEYNPE
jgi:hypothetical protein